MKQSPRFDAVRHWLGVPADPRRHERDAAIASVMEFDTELEPGRIPVVAGASFNLWNPMLATPLRLRRPKGPAAAPAEQACQRGDGTRGRPTTG